MYIDSPSLVRVIVDPNFGERLASLSSNSPAWIVESPPNTAVAQRLRRERPEYDVTTFRAGRDGGAESDLLGMLGTIDEHHGEHAAGPTYSFLEVIGCLPSEQVNAALAELSFHVISSWSDGFCATNLEYPLRVPEK